MKKLFLMGAVASLGLLASCSSDDDLSTGGNGKDGLQQIKIGMGVQASVGATRGTGTVGNALRPALCRNLYQRRSLGPLDTLWRYCQHRNIRKTSCNLPKIFYLWESSKNN